VPEPVFYCSIESPSLSKLKNLETALENLQREDPSFKVSTDKDSGQVVIKGMGELHIEVFLIKIANNNCLVFVVPQYLIQLFYFQMKSCA
jgi:elongation factor G